jgi:hypothetical protein
LVVWTISSPNFGAHSLTVKVVLFHSFSQPWSLTTVYGTQEDVKKIAFLQELHTIHASLVGPWAFCGDFYLIYQAQ